MHALAHEVILPWSVFDGECGEHIYIMDAEDSQVVRFHKCQGDIAKHVVACVNACRGISTDDLLTSNFGEDSVEVGTLLGQTMQQRDDLLEALRRLEFAAQRRDSTIGDPCRLIEVKAELSAAAEQARSAIAKATGLVMTDSDGGHCD